MFLLAMHWMGVFLLKINSQRSYSLVFITRRQEHYAIETNGCKPAHCITNSRELRKVIHFP